jgi:hypothetical protein
MVMLMVVNVHAENSVVRDVVLAVKVDLKVAVALIGQLLLILDQSRVASTNLKALHLRVANNHAKSVFRRKLHLIHLTNRGS